MSHQAGVYLRISEDRSGDGLAVDRQRADCRQLIQLRGWDIAEEFVDNDLSGAGKVRRPRFEDLLNAVADGSVTVIVAWALDRLGRNRTDHHRLVDVCQKQRVSLALVRGSDVDLSSAIGRGVADMMATFARLENEQRSERQRRQIDQAAKAGFLGGGAPRAFGYLRGGMELNPSEAPILAQAYERWLAGAGLEELTDWMNRQCTTARGNRWRSNTLSVVLRNPRNGGLRAMRPVKDEATGRRSGWHDPPIGPAAWPGVVSEEVWQASLAKLKSTTRPGMKNQHKSKGPTPKYLLSGIAKCGMSGCGLSMITTSSHGIRRYHCSSKRHFNRRAEYMEAFITQTLLDRLQQDDACDLLLPDVSDDVDLDAVRAERLAKRQKLRGLAADYADGVLDREQVKIAGDEIRARLVHLDAIVAKAGAFDPVAPLVDAEDPAKVWETYLLSTQRLVLTRLMEITVHRVPPGRPPGGVWNTDSIKIRWIPQQ